MIEAVAVLFDPVSWLVFGAIGVLASVGRPRGAFISAAAVCVVIVGIAWPSLADHIRFAASSDGPVDSSFNPLTLLKGTKYEERYLNYFIGAGNARETRQIERRIDQYEADCAILHPDAAQYELRATCSFGSRIGHLMGGGFQSILVFVALVYLQQQRDKSRKV